MRTCRKTLSLTLLALFCVPALAQDQADDLDSERREAEERLVQTEIEIQVVREHEVEERAHAMESRSVEVEVRMREAEHALELAAREVAVLSMRQLPRIATVERIARVSGGPVLGVTIFAKDNDEPVEGVEVNGVSPGGAAAEAGIRAGDVITAINGESFTSENSQMASDKLLDFMTGVESGDELSVDILRNGKSQTVDLIPQSTHVRAFTFDFDGDDFVSPDIHFAPDGGPFEQFLWMGNSSSFGDMEMVKLTERLGSYFGTTEGLLIVRAPDNDELQLQDGDVIREIDGRAPTSVSHAMRILGSYESGETVKIEIMRDKRKKTISIEMPDARQSQAVPPSPPVRGVGTVVMPKRVSE
jgi:C-terminal processing protease CtpA/Prc